MSKNEALAILVEHLRSYRALTYQELAGRVDTVETAEIQAASGTQYQIEIQFVWDANPNADVRVIGSVDDGGWSAFLPLSDGFIRAPDGTFVDE